MSDKKETTVNEVMPAYNKHYTFTDYMSWDDDQRWEIIDGELYMMSAPTTRHQEISGNLFLLFGNHLKGKTCNVYYAPFDVCLKSDTTDDTVVQPDLVIICDDSIMMKTGCSGAPDMVIEILSPSTATRDFAIKLTLYERTGVREYWVVSPDEKQVITYILENERYIMKPYSEKETAPVHILEDYEINLAEVFAE